MVKIRVHDLARKLNMSNQELIAKLVAAGFAVRTHSSAIDEDLALKAIGHVSKLATKQEQQRPRTLLRKRRTDDEAQASEESTLSEDMSKEHALILEEEKGISSTHPPLGEPALQEDRLVSAQAKAHPLYPPFAPYRKEEAYSHEAAHTSKNLAEHPSVGQNNVVRVIEASAIRARLAAEGRTFKPRLAPGGYVRAPLKKEGEQTPHLGPLAAGVQPAPSSTPSLEHAKYGKPGFKKKGLRSEGHGQHERKELQSGGYELWLSPGKKKKHHKQEKQTTLLTQAAAHKRVIEINGPITVNELAHRMSVKAGQLVAKLMNMGMMVTVNQPIDLDTASIVASEFEFEVKNVSYVETDLLKEDVDTQEQLERRAPVVTVMGHVDHGKTSLLDCIRQSDVAKMEAGGITQHIGAYSVHTSHGSITFLDTPGHEAFTAMRARGARVTDVVVLVVAADDGVMPQTIEAIHHAKAANVTIVVAINKIDAPGAQPERIKQQLSEHALVSEEWGGDVLMFPVSAIKKQGIEELLEGIYMQAEILDLKANPHKRAMGFVVESRLDKGRGPVATILIQAGTLRQGDFLVAGECSGRVRVMYNSAGEILKEAGPSSAVQILGLNGVCEAGDSFNALSDDKTAKTIAEHRIQRNREQELMQVSPVTLENFLQKSVEEKLPELKLIVKADAFGSVEALVTALKGLSTKEVQIQIIHSGVGAITESDVNLAVASKGIIIGFNTKPDGKAHDLSSRQKVDIRSYSVIYTMLDEIRLAMQGMLEPVWEESYLGSAEIRMVFQASKIGQVAGCYVKDGRLVRSAKLRITREGEVIYQGKIASLKRFKEDVREVTAGYECGVGIESSVELKEKDMVECFEQKQVEAQLTEALPRNSRAGVSS